MTCDTGVSAHDAIQYAGGRGVDTIVTDHHALPETLPAAARCSESAPACLLDIRLLELPGVGVAYKLIEALYRGEDTDFLLDLVALGIVADVMVQVDDTRYLLQRGLGETVGESAVGPESNSGAGPLSRRNNSTKGISLLRSRPDLNALGRLD